jgi:hypothetical protein
VAIEREEELQRVLEKDLDRRVEQGHGEEPSVRAVSHRKHVVRHFEGSDVHQSKLLRLVLHGVR